VENSRREFPTLSTALGNPADRAGFPHPHSADGGFYIDTTFKLLPPHAEAKAYLEAEYLPEHNGRFARGAARPEDYHRRAPGAAELDRIFRLESERAVSPDRVVRYANRFFQLERQRCHYAPAKGKVVVCEGRDGSLAIEYRGQALCWHEIPAPAKPKGQAKRPVLAAEKVRPKGVPPPDHPWRQAACRGRESRAIL